jgi:hypothetical protein
MATVTEHDWGRIFARAWTDKEFHDAYAADPRAALKKYGKSLGVDPDATFNFPTLPQDLTEEKAKAIAEGSATPQPMYCC